MIEPGWRTWSLAVALSILAHAALAINFKPKMPGALEKPAGAPVSVSGSLASVLGGAQQSEPVAAEDAQATDARSDTTAAETVEVVASVASQTPPSKDAASLAAVVDPPSMEPAKTKPATPVDQVAPVTVRSRSTTPIAAATSVQPAEVTTMAPQPANTERVEPRSRQRAEQARAREREREREREQARREARRIEDTQKEARRRAAAARSRAGSQREGAAGQATGGRGGSSRAAAGAVLSYGAQVRARILANRPSATGSGVAVVSFGISSGGGLTYARLLRSSGSASLDDAAVRAVRRSSPFPSPPVGASVSQLRFSISFSFR